MIWKRSSSRGDNGFFIIVRVPDSEFSERKRQRVDLPESHFIDVVQVQVVFHACAAIKAISIHDTYSSLSAKNRSPRRRAAAHHTKSAPDSRFKESYRSPCNP